MEDFQTGQVLALSAHLEGLEAALEALPDNPDTAASLRRIARSLSAAAVKAGASSLADAAHRIQLADDEHLEETARGLLQEVAAGRERSAPRDIRVLLVEDDPTIATAIRAYLRKAGHAVHHAASATEAERHLAELPIDLVLLDLILPDRDGRDLLIQMRESPATANTPVIVLSAKGGSVAKAECLAVGAAEFLEKPVDPSVLRASVARHARPRGEHDAGAAEVAVPGRAELVEAFEPLRLESSGGSPAAVALLALNDFAAITRELGDDGADRLVAAVALPLAETLEGRGMVGRWRRGELVLLYPRTTADDAKRKVTRGMARVAASGALEACPDGRAEVSFSAGVAVAEGDEDLRDVVSAAEQSLYRARSAGRGVIVAPDAAAPERERRVLLVEDDRVTATLIHHRLVREGFEVVDFLNGEDAHEWALDAAFDLAILDVKVPGMDGFELLERLRAIDRLDAVPIVMLTGLGGEADVVRGLELGANDYMLKPFSPTELLARVRRLVFGGASGASDAGGPRVAPAGVGAH